MIITHCSFLHWQASRKRALTVDSCKTPLSHRETIVRTRIPFVVSLPFFYSHREILYVGIFPFLSPSFSSKHCAVVHPALHGCAPGPAQSCTQPCTVVHPALHKCPCGDEEKKRGYAAAKLFCIYKN